MGEGPQLELFLHFALHFGSIDGSFGWIIINHGSFWMDHCILDRFDRILHFACFFCICIFFTRDTPRAELEESAGASTFQTPIWWSSFWLVNVLLCSRTSGVF